MKEIDINIEGYNVNGICVGCLNYNRKMFYRSEIQECFKNIADIDVPDGLSIQVCWECLAAVRNANRFREQILQAYNILIDYSKEHTFLNSPHDLSQYSTQRLTSSHLEHFFTTITANDFGGKTECDVDVKSETEEKIDTDFDKEEPKEEGDFSLDIYPVPEDHKLEADYSQDAISDFLDDPIVSSDDDVQLSILKSKKRGRSKKNKKKKEKQKSREREIKKEEQNRSTRKLKNLPENLVELYTLSEEEMWQIRRDDLSSKEFLKLKYKCEDCIIGFNTEKLMSDHFSGKHRPKGDDCQQCDICKAYLLTKDNLSIHRSLHMTAFKCIECMYLTCLKRNMVRHVGTHTGQGYPCGTCEKMFSTKSKLSYHKNVCHQEKPQCDCCGKVFANKMTLKYHLKIYPHNKEEKPKEKLYLPCKGCDKVFHSKKSYRAHVVIHDGVTYPCPICGKLFQWKRNLARHTRAHREREAGARHECRECGKMFASRDCLNNHRRLSKRHVPESALRAAKAHVGHATPGLTGDSETIIKTPGGRVLVTDEPSAPLHHTCNYCGKKFATKWCMVDHIDWDHLKRIKYQCSVCFKAFKTAKIMVAHMNNIHEGKRKREAEGEHLCEMCGKSYKTVKRLKGHVWAMHTNRSSTKSYRCAHCPATFTWQTSIYKHVKMMHQGKRTKQPSATSKQADCGLQYSPHMQSPHLTQFISPSLRTAPQRSLTSLS